METLTKENFWNQMKESFPSELDSFCKWIDEYKKKVGWSKLFNEFTDCELTDQILAPKYHDLPIAMQIGIFFQYVIETGGTDSHESIFGEVKAMHSFPNEIIQYFTDCKSFVRREREAGENFEYE